MPAAKPSKANKNKKPATGEGQAADVAALKDNISKLELQNRLLNDTLQDSDKRCLQLKSTCAELQASISKASTDYVDILTHKERLVQTSDKHAEELEAQCNQLQEELRAANLQLECKQAANEEQGRELVTLHLIAKLKEQVLEDLTAQAASLADSQEAYQQLQQINLDVSAGLKACEARNAELALRLTGSTQLRILFDDVWLVQISRHRMSGPLPVAREGNTISCFGGQLVMYGGASGGADVRELVALDLESLQWGAATGPSTSEALHDHTASACYGDRLLAFGGQRDTTTLADMLVMQKGSLKWTQCDAGGGEQPSARHSHATAAADDKVYMYGGVGEDGMLLEDLWQLDLAAMTWQQITLAQPPSSTGQNGGPGARRGASLCASEDGGHLWLFGGNDGKRSTDDLHCFNTETGAWVKVAATGAVCHPREHHCASIADGYMLVSGGRRPATDGGLAKCTDIQVLDTAAGSWEQLESGAWCAEAAVQADQVAYSACCGRKGYALKPNGDGALAELQILEVTLPSDIERMKQDHLAERLANVVHKLHLLDDAVRSADALELTWRPPTKGSERIVAYKVMVATSAGVVREAYQGIKTKCRVADLRGKSAYIICVKATYDDGSFVWSEPKTFHTTM